MKTIYHKNVNVTSQNLTVIQMMKQIAGPQVVALSMAVVSWIPKACHVGPNFIFQVHCFFVFFFVVFLCISWKMSSLLWTSRCQASMCCHGNCFKTAIILIYKESRFADIPWDRERELTWMLYNHARMTEESIYYVSMMSKSVVHVAYMYL